MDPQSYEDLAEHFERLTELEGDPVGDWLATVLPERGGAALDLGCGAGRHAVLLAERFDRVVAIDSSPAMIEQARATRPRANVDYRVADLWEVDGSYDLVFSSATLHHLPDVREALDHARERVAPGGTAVLVDVVARRAAIPRWMFRLNAATRLALDVARRRPRPFERYRLATDPRWLDHLVTDRYLNRVQFETVYGGAFPGARFQPVAHLHASVWHAG